MYEIEIYKTSTEKEPFTDWIRSLDKPARSRIRTRLTRIRDTGNLGDCEPARDGVYELKFDFGPGYRVYFGYKTDKILILLFGGYKKSQQRDIDKSIEYWNDHISNNR